MNYEIDDIFYIWSKYDARIIDKMLLDCCIKFTIISENGFDEKLVRSCPHGGNRI